MDEKVNIRLETDPSFSGTEVIIRTSRRTKLTDRLISAIEMCSSDDFPLIPAYTNNNILTFVEPQQIIRIYTENRKLIIRTENGQYESHQPLWEVEKSLTAEWLVRISRFEIVNLRKATGFDFSNAGTIRMFFQDGSETWVARRYVRFIQEKLKSMAIGKEASQK
ncbi:MAG: LytTR family transcriptional regulator DNA-binding domain-containing protein [Clostridia bacterium]|nr:LytTR family transcriptional regulator DNA-binding domain-containing protein [Clostridia bacterium]